MDRSWRFKYSRAQSGTGFQGLYTDAIDIWWHTSPITAKTEFWDGSSSWTEVADLSTGELDRWFSIRNYYSKCLAAGGNASARICLTEDGQPPATLAKTS